VLEVSLYGLVRHTGTSSLTGLKPCHHFFLMTAIHRNSYRNSFVVTERVFWAQNITHNMRCPVIGRGRESDERGREREGAIGPYRYFVSPTLIPGWGYGLMVVASRGYVRGRRVVLDSHGQLSVVN